MVPSFLTQKDPARNLRRFTCDPNETGTITLTPNPTSYTIDQLRIIRQP